MANDPFSSLTPSSTTGGTSGSTPDYFSMAKSVGDSAQASAVTGSFDESKGVAGRVQQLTDFGGPLMTAARTRARQRSVKMGLQNSSTAAQAGEQAVIETATPIAGADAQLYQQQQLANQAAQNTANLTNAQIRAQTGMTGLQLGESSRQFDTGLDWDKSKTGMTLMEQRRQFDANLGLQTSQLSQNQRQFDATMGLEGRKLDQNQSQFDSTLGLEGKKLTQNQQQFDANLGIQSQQLSQQDRQFMQNLQLQRDDLTARREQFAQQLGLDTAQLQLNRDNLTQQQQQFLAQIDQRDRELAQQQTQFTSNLAQQQSQFNANMTQQGSQFAQNLQLQRDNLEAQRDQFAQKLGLDKDQLQLSRDQLSQQDRQFLDDLNQRERQLSQQESQFTRDQQNKVTLANLDASNREKLIEIEAKYKTDIASNENISRAWGTMMDSINQIQNNPELDSGAKQTLINNTQASFQSFAAFWNKVSGGNVDLSDLLRFSSIPTSGSSNPGGVPGNQYYDPSQNGGYTPPPGDRGGGGG